LVKEADALTEAGFRVEVVCGYGENWALHADRVLLKSKTWSCNYVGGSRTSDTAKYWWTRLRYGLAKRLTRFLGMPRWLQSYTILRTFVELERKAASIVADLYIAHNIEALPAAAAAAAIHRKPLGFDAEDVYTGMLQYQVAPYDKMIGSLESEYLPNCAYVTAASPGTSAAYVTKYGIPPPVCILNAFPLSLRRSVSRGNDSGGQHPLRLYWVSQTIGDGEGLEDIIRAMGIAQPSDIQLHLQGQWHSGYRDRLFDLASSVGVAEHQIRYHPPVDPDQLVGLSAEYDVGLALQQPIDENSNICLTNKLFMYVLAGNAVIATATESQTPFIQSLGPAGFLYEPGDISTLAAGLRKWHDDRALLRAARDHAWHLGTTRYNWDIEKQRFLNIVETVLRSPGRALA
jgi:glycosyltransferase involved in cell wall biosynthesis